MQYQSFSCSVSVCLRRSLEKKETRRWSLIHLCLPLDAAVDAADAAVHAVVAAAERETHSSPSVFSIERESPVLLSFNPSISSIVLCILLSLSLKHHFGL